MTNVTGNLADQFWPDVRDAIELKMEEYMAGRLGVGEVTEVRTIHVRYGNIRF